MRHLSIDIETYSSVDLKKAGLYKYVQSPDFTILLFAYSFDGQPVRIVDLMQGETYPPEVLFALSDHTVIKHAYNAAFEWYCLNKFGRTPLEQWHCTMLHGLYCGYTAGLAATGAALGLPKDKQKLATGNALIKIFCTPTEPKKSNNLRTRTLPQHEPEKWQLFKEYCCQDVVTEMEIERRLSAFPVPDDIQAQWVLDQQINVRGVRVDRPLISGALRISGTVVQQLTAEAVQLSGLANPKSVQQLLKWLQEETGDEVENLRKDTVSRLIDSTDSQTVKRVLQIRQELSKTSNKKYAAMDQAAAEDERVRGLTQFYGANRTGRWAGRLVQLQNLPKSTMDPDLLAYARDLVRSQNLDALQVIFKNIPDTLSQLIRTAFIPAEGNTFFVADFSAIEARVIAWLAKEEWRLNVFATHGKIYEASASAMFGVPLEKIKKGTPEYALRQKGKVAELALGYQGGSKALITMGALKMGLAEEELPDIVRRWRASNRRIVDLWYKVENAALSVMHTGQPTGHNGILFALEGDYATDQSFMTITLPSRRKLFYAKPYLAPNQWGNDSLHYYGMNQTTKKWGVQDTYGGKLVENIVQAIARDCLMVSLQRLTEAGYHPVFHVHDEVICDDPAGSLDQMYQIMGMPIDWAPGLILRADGFSAPYYKKE